MVGTGWVNTVFVRDDLPEFGTNLVTALTGLKVDNLSHDLFDLKIMLIIPKTQNYISDLLVFGVESK